MQEIERISATVPRRIKDEMEQIAKERHMSVSGLVAELCEEFIHKVRGTYCEVCKIANPPGAAFWTAAALVILRQIAIQRQKNEVTVAA